MNAQKIEKIIQLKKQLFNFTSSSTELLLYQGLLLHRGYSLIYDQLSNFNIESDRSYFYLKSLYHTLQKNSGLQLLGPQKYWSSGDEYLLTISDPQNSFSKKITLLEPFNEFLEIPFTLVAPVTINLKLIKFGGNNLQAWESYLAEDWDQKAINSQQALTASPKDLSYDLGLKFVLRDLDYLYCLQHKSPHPLRTYLENFKRIQLQIITLQYLLEQTNNITFKAFFNDRFELQTPIPWSVRLKSIKLLWIKKWNCYLSYLPFKG